MRIARNFILTSVIITFGGLVAGCDTLDSLQNLSIFDNKKKLPGERKSVFPEGVPGVSQGIPPELMKGYQESQSSTEQTPDPVAQAATTAAEEETKTTKETVANPKPATKPKRRVVTATQRPQRSSETAARTQAAPSQQESASAPWPASEPQQPQAQQAQVPWPSAQPQASWPASR